MRVKVIITLIVCVIAASLGGVAWSEEMQRVKAGDVRPFMVETEHPYGAGDADRPRIWTDVVSSPGAQFVRVYFANFDLREGDFVSVSNPNGSQFWTYSLKGPHGTGKFWSFAVDGDTAIVRLHAGPNKSGTGFGYVIDRVGHGEINLKGEPGSLAPTVVCKNDGREDIACRTSNGAINTAQRSVARLLFVADSDGLQYVCTGWLVAGSNQNTMMTNNHCISSQNEASSLQAKFNYQRTTCGGTTNATTTDYAGGTFLKTSSGLDYTLMTLQGNPSATWGQLTATTKSVAVGNTIWFIQHPGGGLKKIGYYEDRSHTTLCKVASINQSYGGATSGSQMGYGCDSEGGSSGSPIVDAATGRVIGSHHFGGVSNKPCLNSATEMPEICANAGSLLTCATN